MIITDTRRDLDHPWKSNRIKAQERKANEVRIRPTARPSFRRTPNKTTLKFCTGLVELDSTAQRRRAQGHQRKLSLVSYKFFLTPAQPIYLNVAFFPSTPMDLTLEDRAFACLLAIQ